MKIDINITPEFIVDAVRDYCERCSTCPTGCVFDQAGICAEHYALNEFYDKYHEYIKKEK